MKKEVLLGDEAVALAAIHSGIRVAYAYPGTPSTEIMEYILRYAKRHGFPKGRWTTNEKTAMEEALGVSMLGQRSIVSMKHVGLNVAADPFINGCIVDIRGGLVVAVADDPGMHSSQNEQDSRYYADFAQTFCLEPSNQQEAYAMTRYAFHLSETYHLPVMVRLVTRLAHSRGIVAIDEPEKPTPLTLPEEPTKWILLPSIARKQYDSLLAQKEAMLKESESSPLNTLQWAQNAQDGIITTGLARNYYEEIRKSLGQAFHHLHIGMYPLPKNKIQAFMEKCQKLFVIEEGYPYLERFLSEICPNNRPVIGKLSGHLPPSGELTPERVARLFQIPTPKESPLPLPPSPPQLCQGCPHSDTYEALKAVLADYPQKLVTSDIGCYTLGAYPPYEAIHSCVCMGASVSMAKGAADAGQHPVVAVIGDSTFLHSGIPPLLDAVAENAHMTLIFLDNATVAMTGGQPTILPSSQLEPFILGCGVSREHLKTIYTHPRKVEENQKIVKEEIEYPGLSVIIAVRECIETAKRKKRS